MSAEDLKTVYSFTVDDEKSIDVEFDEIQRLAESYNFSFDDLMRFDLAYVYPKEFDLDNLTEDEIDEHIGYVKATHFEIEVSYYLDDADDRRTDSDWSSWTAKVGERVEARVFDLLTHDNPHKAAFDFADEATKKYFDVRVQVNSWSLEGDEFVPAVIEYLN
jgi:hypothetical protein